MYLFMSDYRYNKILLGSLLDEYFLYLSFTLFFWKGFYFSGCAKVSADIYDFIACVSIDVKVWNSDYWYCKTQNALLVILACESNSLHLLKIIIIIFILIF